MQLDVVLIEQRLAGGDPSWCSTRSMPPPRSHARGHDQLGDRVLDLEPGVHLEEVDLAGVGVEQELDGAGVDVADVRGQGDGRLGDPLRRAPSVMVGAGASSSTFWCRRWVEQSRSNRCTHVAVGVGDDLDLDVAAVLDVLLDQHGVVAERRRGLALRGGDGLVELLRRRGRCACPCRRRRRRP